MVNSPESHPQILIRGAGVAGLVTAVSLARHGASVTLVESGPKIGSGASWLAGGMLAPWCEAESAPPEVTDRSLSSLSWWSENVPNVVSNGSLVLAPARDTGEISRFARRTSHFREITGPEIAALEPDLADRFARGLFFPNEGHLDPRQALPALAERLIMLGGRVLTDHEASTFTDAFDWEVDCTGLAARREIPDLRGVRGEMILLRCPDVMLSRPVRLLHPRIPIYIVPRANNIFMVGATMIESENGGPMTLRSMSELLNAAWVLHPAFAEAEILEMGAGLRPSYVDNLPAVTRNGRKIQVNGMYRHGYLLSPWLAGEVANMVFG
ncbi:thiamine biosynthesis oxidoreductase ThiO [Acetobacter nitrogenifigens DSM 23921 = NBRC 105050]|uniref:D-amino-acid oxidase n=1 Tax=Acetobacter nitrogenifigens DSM 23921 = NBRC 105050 TaxID=1120919 RepID=A0A511XDL3_9PROT|nr:glycine oxidase ThiO [Acetobacter nitrogenifigens]GBQ97223.1 thiamine biosynthesis oxidoreductase ThiO [Acetobacter nitrogenifigens DSM 23921 = NBRC 105050]GEN60985.1 glycine oxidase ThiO [Acetobacter nitrogenifigens DSM 23921 = NBRC 105050]